MKRTIAAALLGLVCVVALCGCRTPHLETVWEYKQVYARLGDSQLNDYARQGWQVGQVLKGLDQGGNEWHYVLLQRRVPAPKTVPQH